MILDLKNLKIKYNIQSKGVLHIGAHEGQEAETYHFMGMDNMVFIEANPDTFKILSENLRKFPNSKAVLACIGEKEGEKVKFNIASNGGQSSSVLELGTHSELHPEVVYTSSMELITKRVEDAVKGIDMNDIDFLNIDLQGSELSALKSMGTLLEKFNYAYLEVNKGYVYKGCALIEEIDAYLSTFGFVRRETEWVNQWGDAFYVKEGKEVLPGTFSVPIASPSLGDANAKTKSTSKIIELEDAFIVGDGSNFEGWFGMNISSLELPTERMYLPIQWSAYYIANKNGRDKASMGQMQHLLDSLDITKKYFTIVEWSEGIMNYFNGKDIKVFGTDVPNVDFILDLPKGGEDNKKFILEKLKEI